MAGRLSQYSEAPQALCCIAVGLRSCANQGAHHFREHSFLWGRCTRLQLRNDLVLGKRATMSQVISPHKHATRLPSSSSMYKRTFSASGPNRFLKRPLYGSKGNG